MHVRRGHRLDQDCLLPPRIDEGHPPAISLGSWMRWWRAWTCARSTRAITRLGRARRRMTPRCGCGC